MKNTNIKTRYVYIINYWTNQYFEKSIWDKYICRSNPSTVRKLKELLKDDFWYWSNFKGKLKTLLVNREYLDGMQFQFYNCYVSVTLEPIY